MNNHEVVLIKSGFQNYKLMKSQIINYKNKVISSVLHALLPVIFSHQ